MDLLLSCRTSVEVRDAVWRELVMRARRDGPAWVVAAVGIAMPGLRGVAGMLAAGWRGDTDDLDSELIRGLVARLKTIDLDEPRICGRLIDAGLRAARKARDADSDAQLIHAEATGPIAPIHPWDHPDLVLAPAPTSTAPRHAAGHLRQRPQQGLLLLPPEDAHQLARHTMPELDEHDLSHLDAYRAACRLVVNSRETAAFTLRTNPPRALVGEATAVRQTAAAVSNPAGNRTAIAQIAGVADPPDGDDPDPGNPTATQQDTA